MIIMSEKKLKEFVAEYKPTEVVLTQGNSLKMLRSWAMKTAKETFFILLQYSIWAILLQYAYSTAGYSGLAISLGVAIIYKLDSVAKVRK